MSQIVRSTVTGSSGDLKLREFQTRYDSDTTQDEMEHIEPYGFSSEPYTDGKTDAINLFFDDERNHGVVINVADRRYRITQMKTGEVVIYDDKKRHVYLKRDGIEIDGVDDPITVKTTNDIIAKCDNLTATCKSAASVNCDTSSVTCKTSATVTAPTIMLDGNVTVTGTLITGTKGGGKASFGGTVNAKGVIHSEYDITAGSISLQHHVHTGVQGGNENTGTPS